MELSGLIFVALALVWAVVLIPKALRHHDDLARTRSVADVSDDVRVVPRQTTASRVAETRPAPAPRRSTGGATAARDPRRAAARAAARRRRILGGLLLLDLAVAVAAVTGLLRPWAPAVPTLLTLAFLVVARVTVRHERARRQRDLQRRRRTPNPTPPVEPATVTPVVEPASAASRVETTPAAQAEPRNEQGLTVVSGLDDTSSIPVVRVEGDEDGSGSLWDPLPVTLPTYVTKPRANRSVRTIDLSAPGVSSSGRDAAASALVAEAATAAAAGGDEAARAVGS